MLSFIVSLLLAIACALVAVPIAVLFVQIVVAPRRLLAQADAPDQPIDPGRPPIAVIVPAHNESSAVGKTIATLKRQLSSHDRLLVVADNCTDDTAEQALKHGATVVERHDLSLRGKGYALDHGWKTLREDKRFALFLCVDADCMVHPGAVNALAKTAVDTGRPTQALYLILNEGVTSVRQRISEFAYIVNSLARPLGFARLGLPCQLVGSGMMFSRACLEQTSLASGHLVEDLLLGLTLAAKGQPPVFCDAAYVSSSFPTEMDSQEAQRTRWEHGRLSIITQVLPQLIVQSIRQPNLNLLALALDAGVPPLTLLMLVQVALTLLSGALWSFTGQTAPLWVSGTASLTLGVTLILAWHRFGKERLSGQDIVSAVFYILWKVPLYGKYLFARQTEWVRTKRDTSKE